MNFQDWLQTDEGRLVSFTQSAKEMCRRAYEAGQRNAVQPAAAAIPADVAGLFREARAVLNDDVLAFCDEDQISGILSLVNRMDVAIESMQAVTA